MDARLEGLVEGLNAVRGEEEDALEVLEQAQEDRDEGVAMDVLHRALLEEDVGFVEEEDRVPGVRDFEDLGQFEFEFFGGGAEVAGGDPWVAVSMKSCCVVKIMVKLNAEICKVGKDMRIS